MTYGHAFPVVPVAVPGTMENVFPKEVSKDTQSFPRDDSEGYQEIFVGKPVVIGQRFASGKS